MSLEEACPTAVRATERGLRHGASDDEFAAAMMACLGYAPQCSDHGYCYRDGECFNNGPQQRAVRKLQAFARSLDDDAERYQVERAIRLLRTLQQEKKDNA